jgi:hypothetical protein
MQRDDHALTGKPSLTTLILKKPVILGVGKAQCCYITYLPTTSTEKPPNVTAYI